MSIVFSRNEDTLIIIPDNRLDHKSTTEHEEEILDQVRNTETKVIFDFSKTKYISSVGIRLVLKAAKIIRGKNGRFILCNANENVMEVFEVAGLLPVLHFEDSLESAFVSLSE